MAVHRDCGGCMFGNHDEHDGTRVGHPDVIGGQACMCNGDCDARAAGSRAAMVALAETLDAATTTVGPRNRNADELARVTAERDEMRRLNRQLENDIERLTSERDGVRASLVEQSDDADDLRTTLATRDRQLRDLRRVVERVEALAETWNSTPYAATSWCEVAYRDGRDDQADVCAREVWDALEVEGPGRTHDGSASLSDPVAGAREASEPDGRGWFDTYRDLADAAGRAKDASERRLGR